MLIWLMSILNQKSSVFCWQFGDGCQCGLRIQAAIWPQYVMLQVSLHVRLTRVVFFKVKGVMCCCGRLFLRPWLTIEVNHQLELYFLIGRPDCFVKKTNNNNLYNHVTSLLYYKWRHIWCTNHMELACNRIVSATCI